MIDLYIFAKKTKAEEYAIKRLIKEANIRTLSYQVIRYSELILDIKEKKATVFWQGKRLKKPKMAIFRVAGKGGVSEFYVPIRGVLLAQWRKEVITLNLQTYLRFSRLNKLLQQYYFFKKRLPFVPNLYFTAENLVDYKKLAFPLIVKNKFGSGGRKVFKINTDKELKDIIRKEKIENVLIQPFLDTGHDYRVIVIGGKAIGAMKKTAPQGEFLTNVVRGGLIEKARLTKDLKNWSEEAARIFRCDYCGIDIMFDKLDKGYILEVNRGAQFDGFEKSTGINVAGLMIDFLQKKLALKNNSI